MCILKSGMTLFPVDLVLLEQEFDATGQPLHRIAALILHLVQIQLWLHLDTHFGHRAIGGSIIEFGRMQHRLGRDAAHIEAGAAQRRAAFRTGRFQPQLRRPNRSDIAAGAGTDDEDVVVVSLICHNKFQCYPCCP